MQIRPLRRWRTYENQSDNLVIHPSDLVPQYGDHSYLTNDLDFTITLAEDGWEITSNAAGAVNLAAAQDAGLLDTVFPRRRDAVEALEGVFDGAE